MKKKNTSLIGENTHSSCGQNIEQTSLDKLSGDNVACSFDNRGHIHINIDQQKTFYKILAAVVTWVVNLQANTVWVIPFLYSPLSTNGTTSMPALVRSLECNSTKRLFRLFRTHPSGVLFIVVVSFLRHQLTSGNWGRNTFSVTSLDSFRTSWIPLLAECLSIIYNRKYQIYFPGSGCSKGRY